MCQSSFLMERLPWGISSESVTFLTAEEEHYIGLGHKQNDSFLPDELLEQLHEMHSIQPSVSSRLRLRLTALQTGQITSPVVIGWSSPF